MKKTIIITSIIFVLLIVGSFIFYSKYWFGTLSSDSLVVVNNEKHLRSIKLRPNIYQVKVYDPLKQPSEQTVKISAFKSTSIKNSNSTMTIDQIITSSGLSVPSEYYINSYKFFSNNNWLVLNLINKTPNSDGATVILFYEDTFWRVYSSGTGLADETLKTDNIEVYDYVTN